SARPRVPVATPRSTPTSTTSTPRWPRPPCAARRSRSPAATTSATIFRPFGPSKEQGFHGPREPCPAPTMQTVIPSHSPGHAPPVQPSMDPAAPGGTPITEQRLYQAQEALGALKAEVERRLYGQGALVVQAIIGLLARGNVLIEGQPGLGKTLL